MIGNQSRFKLISGLWRRKSTGSLNTEGSNFITIKSGCVQLIRALDASSKRPVDKQALLMMMMLLNILKKLFSIVSKDDTLLYWTNLHVLGESSNKKTKYKRRFRCVMGLQFLFMENNVTSHWSELIGIS
ncbi:hypothetical protein TNCV_4345921 [Trichonephila clavipes]|nr:hypothetical protein TNCV_4345921 [Trichonephila clavipes]